MAREKDGGHVRLDNDFLTSPDYSADEKLLVAVIAAFQGKKREPFEVKQEKLEDASGLCVERILRSISRLVSSGLLTYDKRKGRQSLYLVRLVSNRIALPATCTNEVTALSGNPHFEPPALSGNAPAASGNPSRSKREPLPLPAVGDSGVYNVHARASTLQPLTTTTTTKDSGGGGHFSNTNLGENDKARPQAHADAAPFAEASRAEGQLGDHGVANAHREAEKATLRRELSAFGMASASVEKLISSYSAAQIRAQIKATPFRSANDVAAMLYAAIVNGYSPPKPTKAQTAGERETANRRAARDGVRHEL